MTALRGSRVGRLIAASALILAGGAPAARAGPVQAPPRIVSLTFDDGRVSQARVIPLLAARALQATFYVISRSVDEHGSDPESLTWPEIERLARAGNEIAGHTRTHPHLLALSRKRQIAEICGSRRDLVARGFPANSFAYPYGEFDPGVERVVRGCGYASARTIADGPVPIPPADRYALGALPSVVATDTAAGLAARVEHAAPGSWSVFVFHDVGRTHLDGDRYRIDLDRVTVFLDWLVRQRDSGAIVIRTVGSVVR